MICPVLGVVLICPVLLPATRLVPDVAWGEAGGRKSLTLWVAESKQPTSRRQNRQRAGEGQVPGWEIRRPLGGLALLASSQIGASSPRPHPWCLLLIPLPLFPGALSEGGGLEELPGKGLAALRRNAAALPGRGGGKGLSQTELPLTASLSLLAGGLFSPSRLTSDLLQHPLGTYD